jgi:hypothetical protein
MPYLLMGKIIVYIEAVFTGGKIIVMTDAVFADWKDTHILVHCTQGPVLLT